MVRVYGSTGRRPQVNFRPKAQFENPLKESEVLRPAENPLTAAAKKSTRGP